MNGKLSPGDPRRIGSYRLIGRLGEGGMGQVFLARTRSGREVAVKLLKPQLAEDPEFRTRFAREVAAARQVGGLHTAAVVEADPEANPPWLATAFVPGSTLQQHVRDSGVLEPDALRTLGAGLADGLAAIHDAGLVHRDLKPANVIMAPDGPRIIDFGIARAVDSSTLTSIGTVLGTYAFMAPEQVRADQAEAASDVFALGCLLVFAADGSSPFDASTVPAVMHRVLTEEPDLGAVPAPLRDLVAACLEKESGDRPSTGEVAARLAMDEADPAEVVPGDTRVATMQDDQTRHWPGGETVAEMPFETVTGKRISRRTMLVGGLAAVGVSAVPAVALLSGTNELPGSLEAETGSIQNVVFTPEGKTLAGITHDGDNGHVVLWDMHSGEATTIITIEGERSASHPVVISPDGKFLAAGDKDVQVWDIAAGSTYATYEVDFWVDGLSFSPDSRSLAVSDLSEMTIRSLASGEVTAKFDAGGPIAYSPDGLLLAVYGSEVLRIKDGKRVFKLPNQGEGGIKFSPDGTLLAVNEGRYRESDTGGLDLLDVGSGDTVFQDTGIILDVSFNPKGSAFVTCGPEGVFKRRTSTGDVTDTITHESCNVVAYGPNGKLLAMVLADTPRKVTLRRNS